MEQPNAAGKKIFFLYPHSVIRDEMFDLLIMNGFESYAVRDHARARLLLEHFPDSIMFINIDEVLAEKAWEAYIREVQENPKTRDCRLGILSYNTDQQLMAKYLMGMSVPCGYIQLKLGMQASTKIILEALMANEARGRRKHIRATCEDDRNAVVNFKSEEGVFYGKLLDISTAGFAAKIENFSSFAPNSKLENIQLRLRGGIVMSDAILVGNRQDDKNVRIFLFLPNMKPNF
ncbi:MAG: PilZ domain-containing protein, partial [Spirochaetaceae bacterium]|nr:PilZ domain-containing protein [Spirochaetaceae bacterium]